MKADGHTGKDIAKYLRVSRATIYRLLAEADEASV
jgi:excisionase family DNA binding protein